MSLTERQDSIASFDGNNFEFATNAIDSWLYANGVSDNYSLMIDVDIDEPIVDTPVIEEGS